MTFSKNRSDECQKLAPALWLFNNNGLKFFVKPNFDISKRNYYNSSGSVSVDR